MGAIRRGEGPPDTKCGQPEQNSYCGLYCVYAAARLLGKEIDFRELVNSHYVGAPEGSSVSELTDALEAMGLRGRAVHGAAPRDLWRNRGPSILHVVDNTRPVEPNHFVLYLGQYGGDALVLHPPSNSDAVHLEIIPISQLADGWQRTAILISEAPDLRNANALALSPESVSRWIIALLLGVVVVAADMLRRCFPVLEDPPIVGVARTLWTLGAIAVLSSLTSVVFIVASPDIRCEIIRRVTDRFEVRHVADDVFARGNLAGDRTFLRRATYHTVEWA